MAPFVGDVYIVAFACAVALRPAVINRSVRSAPPIYVRSVGSGSVTPPAGARRTRGRTGRGPSWSRAGGCPRAPTSPSIRW